MAVLVAVVGVTGALVDESRAIAAPVPSEGLAAIHGVVSPATSDAWDPTLSTVSLRSVTESRNLPAIPVNPDGSYEFTELRPGAYQLTFRSADLDWAPSFPTPRTFELVAGQILEANAVLARAGTIAGVVTPPTGSVLIEPRVTVFTTGFSREVRADPSTGAFEVRGLPAGDYGVFVDDRESRHNRDTRLDGTFALEIGGHLEIDVTMRQWMVIGGVVTRDGPDGTRVPVPGALVQLGIVEGINTEWLNYTVARTDEYGRYDFTERNYELSAPTQYRLRVRALPDPDMLAGSVWNGGQVFSPKREVFANTFDLSMTKGGRITGYLDDKSGLPSIQTRVFAIPVSAGGDLSFPVETSTGWVGQYDFGLLQPGTYIVKAVDSPSFDHGWYVGGGWTSQTAKRVTVTAGTTVSLGDYQLVPRPIPVSRIAGADRFETSVRANQTQFPAGGPIPVAYLVNGLNYADALTAGPAASEAGGALLLVKPDSIPALVMQELSRLSPERIVIVGSDVSISDEVVEKLRAQFPATEIDRLGGSDRYETAALVVGDAFPGAFDFYLATGRDFPDALAAGPAAAANGNAVVIVDGKSDSVPPSLAPLLSRAGGQFQALGTEASLGSEIRWAAASLVNPEYPFGVQGNAIAGANRYETAYILNRDLSPEDTQSTIYLASGTGFADALAAGPLVASTGDPIYLVKQDCIPLRVYGEILDRTTGRVVLLGGLATLSANVAALKPC